MKYTVLCDYDGDFSGINDYLSNGWKLYGNPFGAFDPDTQEILVYQAIIKE